jgi:hypothetical protein
MLQLILQLPALRFKLTFRHSRTSFCHYFVIGASLFVIISSLAHLFLSLFRHSRISFCHSREGGNPFLTKFCWIPAFS